MTKAKAWVAGSGGPSPGPGCLGGRAGGHCSLVDRILEDHSKVKHKNDDNDFVCLFDCLFDFLTSSPTTRLYRGRAPRQRLTILRAATHETELVDHDFCLSRSHYTDIDPTSRERAATAGIEPGTSSPGVARSTD